MAQQTTLTPYGVSGQPYGSFAGKTQITTIGIGENWTSVARSAFTTTARDIATALAILDEAGQPILDEAGVGAWILDETGYIGTPIKSKGRASFTSKDRP